MLSFLKTKTPLDILLKPNAEWHNLKQQCKGRTAEPLISTKPNLEPLLSTLLTKHRTSTLSQTQIQAISQKACKGTTMGANVFNLRPKPPYLSILSLYLSINL